jgi:hypothetical protein
MSDLIERLDSPSSSDFEYPCTIMREAAAALRSAAAREAALVEALKDTTASLIAATSLLERGGKKAAASDKMFRQMLADYRKSVEVGRAVLKRENSPPAGARGMNLE